MKKLCILLLTITILAGSGMKTEEETTTEITDISICTTKTTTELTTEATEKSTESETTTEATFYTTTAKSSEIGSKIAFYYDDGEEVYITAAEYNEICGVVMNETGYGSYEGCIAVAQAIRNQIIRERKLGHAYDIVSVRKTYQEHYTKTPNERVRQAVTDVFYNHIIVTTEPIIAWCAGYSEWHASQIKICSFDGNDFYKLR